MTAAVAAAQASVVPALSAWLSARWLPAPAPWLPDPAWLDVPVTAVSLSASAVSAAVRLVNARAALVAAFGLDPLIPAQVTQLARIVATLNLRLPALAPLAADWRPWSALAVLNGQIDTVQAALTAGLFQPENIALNASLAASAQSPSRPAWRTLLRQLFALLPVVSMAETAKLDLAAPGALASLTATIRGLRRVSLPALAMPQLVLQLVARADAVARLQASLGPLPFPELLARVQVKLAAVQAALSANAALSLSMSQGAALVGMPQLLPNPGAVINAPTLAAVAKLDVPAIAGLNWNVATDAAAAMPLLTVGAPVASLCAAMAAAAPSPVRLAPCDGGCDATRALAAL